MSIAKLWTLKIMVVGQSHKMDSDQRREWDSNPRRLAPHGFSSATHVVYWFRRNGAELDLFIPTVHEVALSKTEFS